MKDKKINKFNLWLSLIMTIICVFTIILYYILGSYNIIEMHKIWYLFFIGFLLTSYLPVLLELIFKLKVGKITNISYQSFLFFSILVGSIWRMYDKIACYDIIVHALSGVLIALIAYSLFANYRKNNKLSLIWLFILVFSVSMACGGLWEIWEFVTDILLDGNSQRVNGLVGRDAVMDTMLDILCDFGGGVIGAIISVFIERKNNKQTNLALTNEK